MERHPELGQLSQPSKLTFPALIVVNALQLTLAREIGSLDLSPAITITLGATVGGTLSLWQFALLHDIKHGVAQLPMGMKPNDVLFFGSQPSLFGYYLYLRYGHLSHHKDFGSVSLKDTFDSPASQFQDGDVLFSAHRQMHVGDRADGGIGFLGSDAVGGRGLSISRSFYSLLWREDAALSNLLVYCISMTYERLALCVNDKIVAVTGSNYFFPNKPADFLDNNSRYARFAATIHVALFFLGGGPNTLLYLLFAELGWQLPVHPACAMFVSNHPSYKSVDEDGKAFCQPTSSVYNKDSPAFDWLLAFTNYHTEHHDMPTVPMWSLPEVNKRASSFYAGLEGAQDSWVTVLQRAFRSRSYYGCRGTVSSLTEVTNDAQNVNNGTIY